MNDSHSRRAWIPDAPAHRHLALVLSLLSGVGGLPEAAGQQTADAQPREVVVPEAALCEACGFEFTLVTSLGVDDGPGALVGEPSSVATDSRGRFFVTYFRERSLLQVFEAGGAFLQDLGQAGGGPGEFARVTLIEIGPGDSIFVFDGGQSRVSVFSPDLGFARQFRFPGSTEDAVIVNHGMSVANTRRPDPSRIGYPLHTVDLANGEILGASYGGDGAHRTDMFLHRLRRLTSAGSRTVWVAHRNQYVIERWDVDGSLMERLARDAPWFPPYLNRRWTSERVDPLLHGLAVTSSGLLRVVTGVAKEDWAEIHPDPIVDRLGNEMFDPATGSGKYMERILEDIDPIQGRVVRRARVPQEIFGFLGPDRAYAYRLVGLGYPRIDIWRVEPQTDSPLRALRNSSQGS